MYIHVEHYIDDADFEDWLKGNGITDVDVYDLRDNALIMEYLEIRGNSGDIVKIL